jgi:citrate lyase subunit beta/citryl-CoA lyase
MWVVHPSQIEIVNEAFTPTRDEYERAVEILAAYERATTEGVGAVRLGAEMIDEASRKMAEGLVARGRDAWGDAAT